MLPPVGILFVVDIRKEARLPQIKGRTSVLTLRQLPLDAGGGRLLEGHPRLMYPTPH